MYMARLKAQPVIVLYVREKMMSAKQNQLPVLDIGHRFHIYKTISPMTIKEPIGVKLTGVAVKDQHDQRQGH